jgi:hypothetical protein
VSRAVPTLTAVLVTMATIAGCGSIPSTAPRCEAVPRLAIVAQSVPGASYVPCIRELPPDWSADAFQVAKGHAQFSLVSRRAGARPVEVRLSAHCDIGDATPTTPRADGVRTYRLLRTISPDYAGSLYDVFPGGCVRYRFDFDRGSHIALSADFQDAVGLFSRRELRLQLRKDFGVDLDR